MLNQNPSRDQLQSRPHSRGASGMLSQPTLLSHVDDYSQNLSAKEREFVARSTGMPLLDVNRHKQTPSPEPTNAGLVGAIASREKEKQQMKEGGRGLMVQQAIANTLQQQQYAQEQQRQAQFQAQLQAQMQAQAQAQMQQQLRARAQIQAQMSMQMQTQMAMQQGAWSPYGMPGSYPYTPQTPQSPYFPQLQQQNMGMAQQQQMAPSPQAGQPAEVDPRERARGEQQHVRANPQPYGASWLKGHQGQGQGNYTNQGR